MDQNAIKVLDALPKYLSSLSMQENEAQLVEGAPGLTSFHLFPSLEPEIRVQIWKIALLRTPRLITVTTTCCKVPDSSPHAAEIRIERSITCGSATLQQVCQESHHEALKAYRVTVPGTTDHGSSTYQPPHSQNHLMTFLTKNLCIKPANAEIVYLPWQFHLLYNKVNFYPTIWACKYRSDAPFGQDDKLAQRFAIHEEYIIADYVFVLRAILQTFLDLKELIIMRDPSGRNKGQWWQDHVQVIKIRMQKLSVVLWRNGVVPAIGGGAPFKWEIPKITFVTTSGLRVMCGGIE